jgi:flagellar hook assembly protein FlgD
VNASGSSEPVSAGTVFVPGLVQTATVSSSTVRPFRDGFQDSTRIRVASNAATKGRIRVVDSRGKLVAQWILPIGTAWSRDWAGRTSSGARVSNGSYRVVTTLEWRGTQRTVSTRSVSVASSQVAAPSVSPSSATVYPVRDGYLDRVTIFITSNLPASGKVTVKVKGKVVWSAKLSRSSSWAVGWNGRTRSGTVLRPGKYTISVQVKGGEGKARTGSRAINVSAKKLTYVTSSKTYSAESARLDCGGFGYVVCETTDFYIGGDLISTTRYYTGFTTDDLLWSSHAVPLPSGTTKWRIRAYAATTDASYTLGYCNSNAADVYDCPDGEGAKFPKRSDGTFVFPWTTVGMSDGKADFFVGSYDWGSLYVNSYTVEFVRKVLK